MGNRSTVMLQKSEIAEIQDETGFTANQIVRLYSRFTSLDKSSTGSLSRADFLRIPELAINPLGDRIVHSFFKDCPDDQVNFRQFVKILSIFRPMKRSQEPVMNTRENKLKFAFQMYDLDQDNKVSAEEILTVLQMMVGVNISDDQLQKIAGITLQENDRDHDGYITLEEFCSAMAESDVDNRLSLRFLS
ncbi:calcineurin B homologous protein 1-like [Paramacrobiotus metropolitanus]|uniref:calcineurin B homologous protein 1-like n=1 Tax=Paramacrobiotus metropolitanus TaxID=2943436 RepID=UPI002445CA96|nr:calcineurin B homologous protein 1-like [Paramacrobiotus metropolitanus]XP_055351625.1 calcineurin B homologous protein 1-like [Paramacrobiotus metropolitanus]XP_055351626.1 calcineurin B homologous protein 1-like [Paramacrobiotus metropolitanus]